MFGKFLFLFYICALTACTTGQTKSQNTPIFMVLGQQEYVADCIEEDRIVVDLGGKKEKVKYLNCIIRKGYAFTVRENNQ